MSAASFNLRDRRLAVYPRKPHLQLNLELKTQTATEWRHSSTSTPRRKIFYVMDAVPGFALSSHNQFYFNLNSTLKLPA